MTTRKYSNALILRYARAGYTASSLADVLKVSRQRASQLLHRAGVKPRESIPLLMRHEVAMTEFGHGSYLGR